MESSRLSARLSAYLNAIDLARQAGVTWAQLGALFGTSGKYMAEAVKVGKSGKYRAQEQLPLPSSMQKLSATPETQRRTPGGNTSVVRKIEQQNEAEKEKPAEFDFEAYRIDKNRC
ncbi:hypothetical protein [Acidithiobacillus sp.]